MNGQAFKLCWEFVDHYLDKSASLCVADIGAMNVNGTYKPIFENQNWKYTGFDIEPGENVSIVLPSGYDWGIPAIFDVVISGQTLEHVSQPWEWLKAVISILKKDGIVFICAPNNWQYHPYPIDAWRVYPDGMKGLFEYAGIEPLNVFMDGALTVGIGKKN